MPNHVRISERARCSPMSDQLEGEKTKPSHRPTVVDLFMAISSGTTNNLALRHAEDAPKVTRRINMRRPLRIDAAGAARAQISAAGVLATYGRAHSQFERTALRGEHNTSDH